MSCVLFNLALELVEDGIPQCIEMGEATLNLQDCWSIYSRGEQMGVVELEKYLDAAVNYILTTYPWKYGIQ